MRKALLFSLLACPTFLLISGANQADAQGRAGGGRGGGGGGGGAARPAARPSPPPGPAGGGAGKTPSLSPGIPSRPAGQPAPVQPKLPSNFQRPAQLPAQLPAVSQPKPNPPKTDIALPKAKAPGIPSTLPARPPTTGLLPGAPARPGDKGPGPGDLGKWTNLPKDPGGPRPNPLPGFSAGAIAGGAGAAKIKNAIGQRPNVGKGGDLVNVNIKNYQRQGAYIRNDFGRHYAQRQWFSPNWWQRHTFAYPRWHYYARYPGRPWSYWWRPATWAACIGWVIAPWAQPFYYDYGTNVVFRDNYVYINDQQVASAPEYANEAIQLASAPPPPDDQAVDFLPLGTFALASTKDAQSADILLQLAIAKDGLISGTCVNDATDKAVAVDGRVDPTTQRVALHMVDQPDIILETGLYNLTQDQTPVLIHFGTTRTQTWFLVRLETPKEG